MGGDGMTLDELYMEGMERLMEDRYDEAIASFGKVLELEASHADSLEGLTQAHVRKNDLEGALGWAKRWAEVAPDAILPHTNLSIIYQKMGLTKEAEHEGGIARTLGWKQELKEEREKPHG